MAVKIIKITVGGKLASHSCRIINERIINVNHHEITSVSLVAKFKNFDAVEKLMNLVK